jgi:DNA polymerase-3 subunit delta
VRLVLGDEELLVARAVSAVGTAALQEDAEADIRELEASELGRGDLYELLSPSLFGGRRVVVVRNAQHADREVGAALLDYAAAPADDICLVLTHPGGAKGKALVDGLRKTGAVVVPCERIRKYGDRLRFVREEIAGAGGSIGEEAAQAVLDAVGNDLRELAAACSQLVSDTGGAVDTATVARYHRGRAEVTGFTVADQTMVGEVGAALESLRWALSLGVDPVPIADALADGVRTVSRVASAGRASAYVLAGELALAPWKVERAQRQARGWTEEGLSQAMTVAARANADVKGAAGDPAYALERTVLAIAAARRQR